MNKQLKKILRRLAEENGTTPKKVEEEMRIAIRAAMQSPEPEARAVWSILAPDGEEPPIELVLAFLIQMYQDRNS